MIKICEICNIKYNIPLSRWNAQKIKVSFCSKNCKSFNKYKILRDNYLIKSRGYPIGYISLKAYKDRPIIIKKLCKSCNNLFETKQNKQNYCSVVCVNNSLARIEQIKITKKEKYGIDTYNNRKKAKITCMKKYGVSNPIHNEVIKQKGIDTLIKNYGVDNISKSQYFKDKYKKTMQKKYGINNYFQLDMSKHWQDTLGRSNPKQINTSKIWLNFRKSDNYPNFLNLIHHKWNKSMSQMAKRFHCDIKTLKKDFIKSGLDYRNDSITLPEKEIYDFLNRYIDDEIIIHDRSLGKELDLYIPNKKFAIEFHGNYWHSYAHNPTTIERQLHYQKFLKCKNNDIFLLQIFEDEWYNKKDIIKSMILSKLGKTKHTIYARKCKIDKNVNKKIINKFLKDNHIQGYVRYNYAICLIYKNTLLSVLAFDNNELVRYCSKIHYNIPGAFSKLLKHCNINNNIKTISNNRYSYGDVYFKNGFIKTGIVPVRYWYLHKNNLLKKLNRRKFQKKKIGIPTNITEIDYVVSNLGYRILFDAGKQKFTKFLI